MTLKQLEAFYWCATCSSFAIAADRLNIAVSSLSKRISELEESLNTTLFNRSGQRATLTDTGVRLLPRVIELLENMNDLKNQATQLSTLTGRCVFGIGELTALTWLPYLIAKARLAHPELMLNAYVDVGAVLQERLERGEIDFAVVAGRSSRPGIVSEPLVTCDFAWMASPAIHARNASCADLLADGVPLVALPPSAGTTRLIDDWLTAHRVTRFERISCNNWGAVAGMLTLSVGVGIIPESWAAKFAESGQLVRLHDTVPLASLTYTFQSRRGDTRPLIQTMRDHTAAVADFSLAAT